MNMMDLTEQKTLLFHRAIIDLARQHPGLISRARDELARLRLTQPAQEKIWGRWHVLLELPLETLAVFALTDDPDGGLLRANSPLSRILSSKERNSIWQRIGLAQFVQHVLHASDDLGLTTAELSDITGVDEHLITTWRNELPDSITIDTLGRLKWVVALQRALAGIETDQEARRNWVRTPSKTLGNSPIALLRGGQATFVIDSVSGAARLVMSKEDVPRMGH